MNRHEGVICNGCMKDNFAGRCFRCLACRDFDLCADCYDQDFTTSEHMFDHPVKCIFTQADIELYFGGEYLNGDPPQSYRCPYCKVWGFNESMFLEHISELHPNASPELVSTVVNLFEQQQAARIFLEEEHLTAFVATANSRNYIINRQHLGIELILRPLNSDGSYQTDDVDQLNDNVIAGNHISRANQLIISQRSRGPRFRNRGGSCEVRNRNSNSGGGGFEVNWNGSLGNERERNSVGGDSLLNGINANQSDVRGDNNIFGNESRNSARRDIINRTIQQNGSILQISLPTIPEQTRCIALSPGENSNRSMSMSERLRLTFCEADRDRVSILMHEANLGRGQDVNRPTPPEQSPPTTAPTISLPTRSYGSHNPTLSEMMRYYTGRINALVATGVPTDTLATSNTTSHCSTANNSDRSSNTSANCGRNRSGRVHMSIGQWQQRCAATSDDPTDYLSRLQRCGMMPSATASETPRTFLSLANQAPQNSWNNGTGISGGINNRRSRVIRLTAPYPTRNVNGRYNGDNIGNATSNGNSTARTTDSVIVANENSRNAAIMRTIEEEMRVLEGIRPRHSTTITFDVDTNSLRQVTNATKTKTLTSNTSTGDKKAETAQGRFLLKRYLQTRCERNENYTGFLANRAEFVSQLLMSALSDDELMMTNRLASENMFTTEKETKPLKWQSTEASSAARGAAGDAGTSVVEPSINNENVILDTFIESSTRFTDEGADNLMEEVDEEQLL